MKKEEIVFIKPGDTCVFTLTLSFDKEHSFERSDLDHFLIAKLHEYFKEKENERSN